MATSIGQELLNVPMGEMIRDMALAIAEAQIALDTASIRVAEMMGGKVWLRDETGKPVPDEEHRPGHTENPQDTTVAFGYAFEGERRVPVKMSMLELGFTPTFYQFVDTIIEVKIAIKITTEMEARSNWSYRSESRKQIGCSENTVNIAQVDGSYASKYGYSAEGASLLRTKLVPVPPPAVLEERIRGLLETEKKQRDTHTTPAP
jgi:hypothetical protein